MRANGAADFVSGPDVGAAVRALVPDGADALVDAAQVGAAALAAVRDGGSFVSVSDPSEPPAEPAAEILRELPMPPWAFGVIAFGAFLVLLGVLWSFRNTAARHDRPAGHGDAHGSQGSHASTDPGAHH